MPAAAALPYIAAATGIYGAISGADSQRKAIHAQQDAAKASQINIDQLNEQTKAIARQNALDSAELERQLTPEVPQLRTAANQSILAGLQDPSLALAQGSLLSGMGDKVGQVQSPLLQAAIAKARSNLQLGGQLGLDTQNAVTRHALATAGSMTGGQGLGMGRDIVARDLGLTSLGLEQQRLNDATTLGGAEANLGFQNAGIDQFNSTNALQKLQLLQAINNQRFNQGLSAAAFGQSINQPLVGLDPTAVGNIAMNNSNNMAGSFSNQANIYGAQGQGMQGLLGTSLGIGALLALNQSKNPYASTSAATSSPYGGGGGFG